MYVTLNAAARWRNICTSLATLTAWWHFSRGQCFHGDLMSTVIAIKLTYILV